MCPTTRAEEMFGQEGRCKIFASKLPSSLSISFSHLFRCVEGHDISMDIPVSKMLIWSADVKRNDDDDELQNSMQAYTWILLVYQNSQDETCEE